MALSSVRPIYLISKPKFFTSSSTSSAYLFHSTSSIPPAIFYKLNIILFPEHFFLMQPHKLMEIPILSYSNSTSSCPGLVPFSLILWQDKACKISHAKERDYVDRSNLVRVPNKFPAVIGVRKSEFYNVHSEHNCISCSLPNKEI